MKCAHDKCILDVKVYWQCPEKGCGRELAYCKDHGGNDHATQQMESHINFVHKKQVVDA